MIGGTLAAVAACVGVWLVVNSVLTYQTASASGGTLFLLFALMGGYLGWQRAAAFFSSPRQSATVGAGVMMALLIYLASSGFPLWYYHEPPISYRLAAFALAAPVCAYVSYRAGALLGWGVVRLVSRESWSGQDHG
jgi:hypothetical protein